MRTTLDIDEDVLDAAKSLAAERRVSAGKVISDLARKALVGPTPEFVRSETGFAKFPDHGRVVTPEFIKTLEEQSE